MKRVLEFQLSRVFWYLILIIFLFPSDLVAQKGELFNAEGFFGSFPKKLKKEMKDLTFIPMGSFNMGLSDQEISDANDSLLDIDFMLRTVSVHAFYMSKTEVTNRQYKEFIKWVKEKRAMDILAKNDAALRDANGNYKEELPIDWKHPALKQSLFNDSGQIITDSLIYSFFEINIYGRDLHIDTLRISIYPDTLVWRSKLGFFEPFVEHYLHHPAYDHYPVVGVSYYQALAYCHWRSQLLYQDYFIAKKVLKQKSHYFTLSSFLETDLGQAYKEMAFPEFRLPTESEWYWAALGGRNMVMFPWGSNFVFDKNGQKMANYGTIRDRNAIEIRPVPQGKIMASDNSIMVRKVASYPANDYGLFDMAGNVAEWCSAKYMESVYRSTILIYDLQPDFKAMAMDDVNRIIKGGSWSDPLVYQLIAAKSHLHEQKSSCTVGFRMVISYY